MTTEPNFVATQARALAAHLIDAARRLDALADDPGGEVIVEGVVPARMVNEWGEALPGFEHLDASIE